MNKKTYIILVTICCIYGCGGGGEGPSVAGASTAGSNVVRVPNAIDDGAGRNGSSAGSSAGQTAGESASGNRNSTNSASAPGTVGEGGSGKILTGSSAFASGTVGEGGTGVSRSTAEAMTGATPSANTANSPGNIGESGNGTQANTINNNQSRTLYCGGSEPQSLLPQPSYDDSMGKSVVASPGSNESVGVISSISRNWIEISGVRFSTGSIVVTNGFNDVSSMAELKVGMTVKAISDSLTENNASNAQVIMLLPSVRGKVISFDGSTMTLDIANKQISITQQTLCETSDYTVGIAIGEFVEIYGYEIQSTNKTIASLIVKIPGGPSSNKPYEILGKLTSVNVVSRIASISGISFSYISTYQIRKDAAVDGAWVRIASELISDQSNPWIIEKMANQNLILTISSP